MDVDWNTLRRIKPTGGEFFYIQTNETYEIYLVFNNMLFRTIKEKIDDQTDMIFFEEYMKNSVRVYGISQVNEPEWRALILNINENISKILTELEEIKDGIAGQ